ncbi:hypothetical protein BOTBODRAFT_174228 [Botryobasidium botryosum FD-172 SS1]|uniref:Uncharacterized protein n=1 Tax=Botryobasidium botryosum (strain FD-172 SS1) TaxID=930990 RepID=A0A067MTZ6_BOTB1|nr:hypothetical protein BOTBODRAFT_174228 [Botryobasidium botryosum FD-172 SS1]
MTDGVPNQPQGQQTSEERFDPPPEVEKCLKIIGRFREGTINKAQAVTLIYSILPREGSTPEAFVAAIGEYIAQLDNIETQHGAAARRAPTNLDGTDVTRQGRAGDEIDRDPSPDRGEEVPPGLNKRRRSLTPEVDSEPNPLKRKVDVGLLPWYKPEPSPSEPSSDVEKTRRLIANYTRDLKQVKLDLLNSAHCPSFPDTEWTNVLSGKFVDLDRVLSGMYSIDPDDRESHSFGGYTITSGSSKPARQVTEHGQWINTWTRAAQALLFAFPHQSEELQIYQEHINDLFAALPRSMHPNVIRYDKAVRIQAAAR